MTLYIQALIERYYAITNGVMLEIKLYHLQKIYLFGIPRWEIVMLILAINLVVVDEHTFTCTKIAVTRYSFEARKMLNKKTFPKKR